ncbi:PREDICTED: uncharacterized protein LOC109116510 [Tarenaya hassleriana]|uniref:uncharacterized protein LOC109116510 n=1 Tax=Tarenaya hassleriana TaxID=28532 RepID=UPI0008FD409D|nr:PREDICTED: uncharacterized protein LOC109116510 [Tarenaya hassleriana]
MKTFALHNLHKALYGLKQTPRAWYNELCRFLVASGFVDSLSDTSLFIFNRQNVIIYLLVYIDDIVITGNDAKEGQQFIDPLASRFSLKDLGTLSFFLGVEVNRTPKGLLLTQRRYISDVLSRHHMNEAKPAPTPLPSTSALHLHSGTELDDPMEYKQLSQFMHRPTTNHWQALKRVLQYLSGSRSLGVFLSNSSTLALHAFSDADWGGNRDDYTSTGSHIVYLGRNPVS